MIAFSTGIFLSLWWRNVVSLFLTGLVVLGSALIFFRRRQIIYSDISLVAVFILIGALWAWPVMNTPGGRSIAGPGKFTIKVSSLPLTAASGQRYYASLSFPDRSFNLEKVLVRDYSEVFKEYYAVYETEAKLSARSYKKRSYYSLWIKKGAWQKKMPDTFSTCLVRGSTEKVMSVYEKNLSPSARQFMAAVFLGRRELLTPEVKNICTGAGAAHLLAISGLHMGLMWTVIFFMLKIVRFRFRVRMIAAMIIVCIYALLVGAQPSNVRAALMCVALGTGFLLKRKHYPLNSFALAGIVSLLVNPQWLFSPGFQLSYTAVGAIFLGYSLSGAGFSSRNAVFAYAKTILLTSFFVSIGILPLTAYYFGRVYLFSIAGNLMLIPLFTVIIAVNFLLLAFSFLPLPAGLTGATLSFLVDLFLRTASLLASLSWSQLDLQWPLPAVVLYYLAMAGTVLFVYRIRRAKKQIV